MKRRLQILSFLLMLFLPACAFGATITSNATGNWSAGGTWVGGVIPVSADIVIIDSAHTVTLTAGVTRTGSLTVSGTLQLAGFAMTSGDLQGAGIITSSSGTPTLTTGSNNTSTTFSGVIGTGAIALTKNGTGVLTFSGSNSYTGLTTIAAGTLRLSNTNALGTTAGATSVTSGAVLDLNGVNYSNAETLTLNGTGISTGGVLINSNATAATYAGNIALGSASRITANNPITLSGIVSGSGTLTVAGAGNSSATLTLSGANTYTNTTTITANAWLKIGSTSALGAGTSPPGSDAASGNHTAINSGGVLDLNGISYSSGLPEGVQLNGTGISGGGCMINSSSTPANFVGFLDAYTPATINVSNPITLSGPVQVRNNNHLTKTGADTLTLAPTGGERSSTIIVNAGTAKLGANEAQTGATTITSGATWDLNGFTCARSVTLNGTGISGSGGLMNSSATAATWSGAVTLGSASSINGETGTIALGAITGVTFGLSLDGAAGGTVTGIISGTGTTLTKLDAGTWTLSGLNTYTGTTTISGGILRATNNTIVSSTNGAFGRHASGLLLNGGTIQSNVATFSRPLTVTATDSGLDAYGSARTLSSTVTLSTAGTFNLNVGGTTAASAEGQNLTLSGVISYSTGTLSLTKIGTSNVSFGSQTITLHDLTISAGALTSTSVSLNLAGNFSNNATFTHNSGTVNFNGTNAQALAGSFATTFNNLTISNTGNTVTSGVDSSVSGDLSVSSGTFDLGSFTANRGSAGGTLTVSNGATLKIGGTNTLPSNYSTHSIGGTSTIEYSGTNQLLVVLNSAQNYENLTISGSGTKTLAGDVSVGGTLLFTNGTITTGVYDLQVKPAGSVTRVSGHVIGNFKKNVATGATSKTFELGDATNYTPVTVAFASVTTAGNLTASTTSADHANIATSTINVAKSVNRNWTLTNSSSIVFTTYDVTFTFVAGDIDGGANTSAFIVGMYSAGWTYPTVGTKTATTTQATGLTAFSDFQLGELTAAAYDLSGNVFEDVNYGGGAGRSLTSSSGVARASVRVELFDSGGTYQTFTTTDGSGNYILGTLPAGTYTVRVVNSSVTSSRGGTSLLPVQTFRTDASSGAAVAVTDHVGGETPGLADAGNGSTTLAALTTWTTTAQSITTVVLSSSDIIGVDFGYSFNVIVNKNDADQGSLRQFITNANALSNTGLAQSGLTAGVDNAVFMLADGTARAGLAASYANQFASSIASITLATVLPTIADPVILDASLQPGYANLPMIELNGAAVADAGLTITAGNSTVRGFIINRFTSAAGIGINITTAGSNTITGNYIGTNALGTAASANASGGIFISSANNTIGGTTATVRNVISGNTGDGIIFTGAGTTGNLVQGNYIGTNVAGTAALANGVGVYVVNGATNNTIGGTTATARNVISGNTTYGVVISSAATNGNLVQGNYIGLNAAGTAALANDIGIYLVNGPANNTIGGTAAGAGNVVSGNSSNGIRIHNSTGTLVQGNYIGTNAAGTAAIGNTIGIFLFTTAVNNTIGGTVAEARNVISGNTSHGVRIDGVGSTGNLVQGNYIGTDAAGTAALANNSNGVFISGGATSNTIGGTAAGAGNLISGNASKGVVILAGTYNAILSNSIYGNTGIGIDLTNDGVTANDGTKSGALANFGMDTPVFSTMTLAGTTLTVTGYVGSAASQATFAGASVQLFKSDGDSSGFGEGQTFLGTLTADASGNFSGTVTVTLAVGDKITGTATDASNNTSEFGANATVANPPPLVSHLNSVIPAGEQLPGTDLVYTATFTNSGGQPAQSFIVVEKIPTYTDFKLGSPSTVLGTTGMTVTVEFSDNNAATWTYTPVSGGGSPVVGYALPGYDRMVTHVRWRFTGNLPQTAPNNAGSVTVTTRIQ